MKTKQLQVLIVLIVAVAHNMAEKTSAVSRGKKRWPGIKLGEADLITGIQVEVNEDLAEENLFTSLTIDGSGGEPVEETTDHFKVKPTDATIPATIPNSSYQFQSHVKDGIQGGQLHRQETRVGNRVTGSYSYSDGFVLRMVEYEADENGYRVVKEMMRRIGNGPKENRNGVANVLTETNGRKNRYRVNGADLIRI